MKRLKELTVQIESARRVLSIAVDIKDDQMLMRVQNLITHLHAEFFDVAVKALGCKATDTLLVFSKHFPDGVVVDQADYKIMLSAMDYEDHVTHTAVPVDIEATEGIKATLAEMIANKINHS